MLFPTEEKKKPLPAAGAEQKRCFDPNILRAPEIFRENCLPAHSDHVVFANEEELKAGAQEAAGTPSASVFRHSLNGLWKFSYAAAPSEAVKGFESPDYDCSRWDMIRVPGHIQMQGYDVPAYINYQYPWDGREDIVPGEIPGQFNPTASYVKYFHVPSPMQGRPLFISFQGVESGFALWLNGHYVGYSEDSFTPSEFDLTPYVREGENKLAVRVFKWTASSWLEDQDFYRFSGIFRDVWLFTVPEAHIYDLSIRPSLDETMTRGRLEVTAEILMTGSVLPETERMQDEEAGETVPSPVSLSASKKAEAPSSGELRLHYELRRGSEMILSGNSSIPKIPSFTSCGQTADGQEDGGQEDCGQEPCAPAADSSARPSPCKSGSRGRSGRLHSALSSGGSADGMADLSRSFSDRICSVSFECSVPSPALWSAEDPQLYDLTLRLVRCPSSDFSAPALSRTESENKTAAAPVIHKPEIYTPVFHESEIHAPAFHESEVYAPGLHESARSALGEKKGSRLENPCGKGEVLLEITRERVGFRRFELRDGLMLLNGKRIVFRGVNRHEFSCDCGRALPPSVTYSDILLMKKNNINAVRTSHYPNASSLYRCCDELGLYLIAENNMESHGSWAPTEFGLSTPGIVPGDDTRWREMLLDRVNSCFQRDKNHPSILIWSVGNESFAGSVIRDMADSFRSLDSSRLVHYEGIFHDRTWPQTSDMESQMYPSAEAIESFLREHPEKPFLCCEYTHAMGNSCGGMHLYTDLALREPRCQGGFIWDFVDQSIRKKNRYGETFQAYGGDFGERPTDYDFSGNGIVDGTRRPYAGKMQEVKYNYQSVRFEVQEKEVRIMNDSLFTSTDAFDCVVLLDLEGRRIEEAPLLASVPPLSEKTVPLPAAILKAIERLRSRFSRPVEKNLEELSFQRSLSAKCVSKEDPGRHSRSACRVSKDVFLRRSCPGEHSYEIDPCRCSSAVEYTVTVSLRLKEDLPWASAGYETAFGQGVFSISSMDAAESETETHSSGKSDTAESLSSRKAHGAETFPSCGAYGLSGTVDEKKTSGGQPEIFDGSFGAVFGSGTAGRTEMMENSGTDRLGRTISKKCSKSAMREISGNEWLRTIRIESSLGRLELTRGSFNIGIRAFSKDGRQSDALFSLLKGGLVSWRRAVSSCGGQVIGGRGPSQGNREYFEKMPMPCFWRAPTSNDRGNQMAARLGVWKLADSCQIPKPETLRIFTDEDSVLLTMDYALPIPVLISASDESEEKTASSAGFSADEAGNYPNTAAPSSESPKDSTVGDSQADRNIPLSRQSALPSVTVGYRFFADASLVMSLDWEPVPGAGIPPMPLFGFSFVMDADYSRFSYYGNGPAENYVDRNRGAHLGLFESGVRENLTPYLVPQECGNRTGVRWAEVTDESGEGLRFTACCSAPGQASFPGQASVPGQANAPGTPGSKYCPPIRDAQSDESPSRAPGRPVMEFCALHYTPHELENAGHPYELPPVHFTNVRCALAQMGVGGDDSWGAQTLPQYCLPSDRPLHFEVSIEAAAAADLFLG